jgi:hypothetical protein
MGKASEDVLPLLKVGAFTQIVFEGQAESAGGNRCNQYTISQDTDDILPEA